MTSLKGRRVLVTGCLGFIGRHLSRRLSSEGVEYFGANRFTSDLMKINDWKSVKPEVVIHCAGVTSGAGIVRGNPYALVTPNLIITANALQAAHEAGARAFIFPSSTTGYPASANPMWEEDYCGSLFEGYKTIGTVKRFLEELAAIYPMTSVALRVSNAFGPGDQFDPMRAHVTAATIRKVAERQDPLVIWGDGSEIRDLLYIDDVVDSLIRAAEWALDQPTGTHEAFNVGRGEGHSVNYVLGQLLVMMGHFPKIVFDKSKPTLLPTRLLNVSKARKILGFEAKVSLEDGLQRTLDWYLHERG